MNRRFAVIAAFAFLVAAVSLALALWFADAFTYPLDDAYIHLAIARTIAESGTWGIVPGEPVFASSSPLWTVLLAIGCRLFGPAEWLPLAFSWVFSFAALYFLVKTWTVAEVPRKLALCGGIAFVLLVPFVTLANIGMEHGLHVCCLMAFLYFVWRCAHGGSRPDVVCLLLSAMLSVGARYESLFVITPVAVLFLLPRRFSGFGRWRIGLALLILQFLPVIMMGLLALSCGRPFVPVSMSVKVRVNNPGVLGGMVAVITGVNAENLFSRALVVILLAVAAVRRSPVCLSVAVAVVGHIVFARLGWLYRYEAYMIACGIAVVVIEVARLTPSVLMFVRRRQVVFVLLAIAVLSPFLIRALQAHHDTVLASMEIQSQQRQTARIFAGLPESLKGPVAIHDLGCMALSSGVPLLDLWGLGSPDVTEAILDGRCSQHTLRELAEKHNVRYFAVFPSQAAIGALPPESKIVAGLGLVHPPVVCAGDTVVFAVTDSDDAEAFTSYLRDFAPSLPANAKLDFLSLSVKDLK